MNTSILIDKLEEILKKSKGGKINTESFWKKEKESFDKIQEGDVWTKKLNKIS